MLRPYSVIQRGTVVVRLSLLVLTSCLEIKSLEIKSREPASPAGAATRKSNCNDETRKHVQSDFSSAPTVRRASATLRLHSLSKRLEARQDSSDSVTSAGSAEST